MGHRACGRHGDCHVLTPPVDRVAVGRDVVVGLRSIAVPVRDARGAAIAAMNVSTHASQVALDEMQQRFLPVLMQGARNLSMVLLG